MAVQYIPAEGEPAAGSDIPGGVMFDVLIPIARYEEFKAEFTKHIGGTPKIIITRNKEKGVPGKARLKIWLQRI